MLGTGWNYSFKRETRKYQRIKKDLLRLKLAGKWITIRSSEVLGIYDDAERAFDAAVQRLGTKTPFLMRQITERDEPVRIHGLPP